MAKASSEVDLGIKNSGRRTVVVRSMGIAEIDVQKKREAESEHNAAPDAIEWAPVNIFYKN